MQTAEDTSRPIDVVERIHVVRNRKVLLDADLAALYGVPTHRLNEAVKRNSERFPEDFAFRVNASEAAALISQIAISKRGRGGRRGRPMVFTEYGALMVASVLNSPRAVLMSVYVVRTFVRLRDLVAATPDLAKKLADLEDALATMDRDTRQRFEAVYAAIRALTAAPERRSRQIGFTAPSS